MKKTFEIPELIIILFNEEDDIITTSALGRAYGYNGDEYQDMDI